MQQHNRSEIQYCYKISQLGIINGDCIRLIEVKFTVNRGTGFWEFEKCQFIVWPLYRGLTVIRTSKLISLPSTLKCMPFLNSSSNNEQKMALLKTAIVK